MAVCAPSLLERSLSSIQPAKHVDEAAEQKARLLDLTTDAIMVRDSSDRITFWNKGATDMYGFSRQEAMGRVSHDLLRTEFPEALESIKEKLLRDGQWAGDLRHTRATGFKLTVSTRWIAERDAYGNVLSVLESNRDISDAQRAQEAQNRIVAIVESSDEVIISKDLSGIITTWNKAAERMFGYTANEAIGQHITLIIPLDRIAEENNILTRIGRGERIDQFETVRKTKDGTLIDIAVTISPIKDATGHVIGASKVGRDITLMKKSERVAALLAAIVDSSNDAIVSKDLHGTITTWNKAAERTFGYTAKEAIGQHITLIVPSDRLDEEAEILLRIQRGERIEHFETVRRRKDGALIDTSITISPIKDAKGHIIGASKVARDITEHKRMDRVLREAEFSGRLLQLQDEERRRFARELHDSTGQLLAAVSMNICAIAEEKARLSPELGRRVDENYSLIQQAMSEIRTISHLLHPPLLDEVGLRSALRDYVDGFAQRSNIRVSLQLPDDLERLPRDAELSLFRIVQECLTNIHRHSGSATAGISLSREPGEIKLQVTDHGRGISRQVRDNIVMGKSSGVGFHGMRERVRQLGGTLDIQSNSNETFVLVVLPIRNQVTTLGCPTTMSPETDLGKDCSSRQLGTKCRQPPSDF